MRQKAGSMQREAHGDEGDNSRGSGPPGAREVSVGNWDTSQGSKMG